MREWWNSLDSQNQIAALGLVVAILAAVPSYLALRANRGVTKHAKHPILSVSVIEEDPPSDLHLSYRAEKADGVVQILPEMGYFTAFTNGGPIRDISYWHSPFDCSYPQLDLKVVNNTARTVFFSEVELAVRVSRLDPSPLLVIKADKLQSNALHFLLLNEGWGHVRDLTARFHLLDVDEDPSYVRPFPFSVHVGDFLERTNISIADAVISHGLDVGPKLGSYSEPIPGHRRDEAVLVSGELEFRDPSTSEVAPPRTVLFHTIVWLYNADIDAAPAPPTAAYSLKLRVEDENYRERCSISHVLKPGETDRFVITTGTDKSSCHEFRVRLLQNDGSIVESGPVAMRTLVPRSWKRSIDFS